MIRKKAYILLILLYCTYGFYLTSTTAGINLPTSNDATSMTIFDCNNDGYFDIAVTPRSSGFNATISVNLKNNTFYSFSSSIPCFRGISSADVNGDGSMDLVVRGTQNGSTVYINNRSPLCDSWTPQLYSSNQSDEAVSFMDVDGDGDLDVVNPGSSGLWTRNDNGVFTLQKDFPGNNDTLPSNTEGSTVADINNDGYLDILWTTGNGASDVECQLALGGPGFTYTKSSDPPLGLPNRIGDHEGMDWIWGDCDNDGDLDVFISTDDGQNTPVGVYINQGNGVFQQCSGLNCILFPVTTNGGDWADIDNDGDLDLFIADSSNRILVNDGTCKFIQNITSLNTQYPSGFLDVDNDGDMDVISANGNLLVNTLTEYQSHFFRVHLVGRSSPGEPQTPIGASVRLIKSIDSTLLGFRQLIPTYNNLQPASRFHFGADPNGRYNLVAHFPSLQPRDVTYYKCMPSDLSCNNLSQCLIIYENVSLTTNHTFCLPASVISMKHASQVASPNVTHQVSGFSISNPQYHESENIRCTVNTTQGIVYFGGNNSVTGNYTSSMNFTTTFGSVGHYLDNLFFVGSQESVITVTCDDSPLGLPAQEGSASVKIEFSQGNCADQVLNMDIATPVTFNTELVWATLYMIGSVIIIIPVVVLCLIIAVAVTLILT